MEKKISLAELFEIVRTSIDLTNYSKKDIADIVNSHGWTLAEYYSALVEDVQSKTNFIYNKEGENIIEKLNRFEQEIIKNKS